MRIHEDKGFYFVTYYLPGVIWKQDGISGGVLKEKTHNIIQHALSIVLHALRGHEMWIVEPRRVNVLSFQIRVNHVPDHNIKIGYNMHYAVLKQTYALL